MREIRMPRTTWRKLETELRGGLRHREMAKASGQLRLPAPVATAPAFDPTDERRLETELWWGLFPLDRVVVPPPKERSAGSSIR